MGGLTSVALRSLVWATEKDEAPWIVGTLIPPLSGLSWRGGVVAAEGESALRAIAKWGSSPVLAVWAKPVLEIIFPGGISDKLSIDQKEKKN